MRHRLRAGAVDPARAGALVRVQAMVRAMVQAPAGQVRGAETIGHRPVTAAGVAATTAVTTTVAVAREAQAGGATVPVAAESNTRIVQA